MACWHCTATDDLLAWHVTRHTQGPYETETFYTALCRLCSAPTVDGIATLRTGDATSAILWSTKPGHQ